MILHGSVYWDTSPKKTGGGDNELYLEFLESRSDIACVLSMIRMSRLPGGQPIGRSWVGLTQSCIFCLELWSSLDVVNQPTVACRQPAISCFPPPQHVVSTPPEIPIESAHYTSPALRTSHLRPESCPLWALEGFRSSGCFSARKLAMISNTLLPVRYSPLVDPTIDSYVSTLPTWDCFDRSIRGLETVEDLEPRTVGSDETMMKRGVWARSKEVPVRPTEQIRLQKQNRRAGFRSEEVIWNGLEIDRRNCRTLDGSNGLYSFKFSLGRRALFTSLTWLSIWYLKKKKNLYTRLKLGELFFWFSVITDHYTKQVLAYL